MERIWELGGGDDVAGCDWFWWVREALVEKEEKVAVEGGKRGRR